jgi:type IV fimbrial biogenesis protein FimT
MISIKKSGYTLLELLITIALVSILMGIGIPSFKSTIESNRLESQAYDLSTVFSLARMEGIDKSVTMSICSSSDQATCSGSNNWANGWILFRDINANGVVDTPDCTDDSKDCVIKVWPVLSGSSVLTANGNFVTYATDGRIVGATINLTLTADTPANCGANQKRSFSVTATGKVNMVKSDCP